MAGQDPKPERRHAGDGARAHADLVSRILAACGARADCRLWSNNTGYARGLTHDGIIKFGLKGSADILGIGGGRISKLDPEIKPLGVFLAIEAKTGNARQSTHQKSFQAMVERFGGFYLVAKSPEDVTEWLDRVLS